MKALFIVFITRLPSVAAIVGATILALNGVAGWGWFLLIAILTLTGVKIKY